MSESQEFWPVEVNNGEPSYFVCMSCMNEVFRAKIPMPACPTCHGVSTYEAFSLESIQDWGTDELIKKAQAASQGSPVSETLQEEPSSPPDFPTANV